MAETPYYPGLAGVIGGATSISSLDPVTLRYRGHDVAQLAEHNSFEQAAFLLLHSHLPDGDELTAFRQRLAAAEVPRNIITLLRQLPVTAAPMDVLRTGTSVLAHLDAETEQHDREANLRKAERLVAQLPVLLSSWHRLTIGLTPAEPRSDRTLAENLLDLVHDRPATPEAARALDASLIMYAEQEFDASTIAVRLVASTLTDLHSAIVAAISALKGPLGGGASAQVMEVLAAAGSARGARRFIENALAENQHIAGFGHRAFKQGDPRAEYLKSHCRRLADASRLTELEDIADAVEEVMLEQKQLRPNVDWPTARLYYYLGLPIALYAPLCAISRVCGWCAHAIESRELNVES